MHRRGFLTAAARGLVCLHASVWSVASAQGLYRQEFRLVKFRRPFPAPAFELPNVGGGTTALSSFQGQFVLLNFWATWCPPCRDEMPSMEGLYQELKHDGLAVVAVSSDREGSALVEPFVQRMGLTFPVLLDRDSKVSDAYGARALPASFVLNRNGMVIAAAKGERNWHSKAAVRYMRERLVSVRP